MLTAVPSINRDLPYRMTAAPDERSLPRSNARDKTIGAVEKQVGALGLELFEVGLYDPDARASQSIMIPRVWDSETIVKSVPWLRHQNRDGRNIYIRPKGEHHLSMVDDLTKDSVLAMKEAGFKPAVIVETSPGNYQAWLKQHERLSKELSTAAARTLAEKFGGDSGAADRGGRWSLFRGSAVLGRGEERG